jgi:hypothetical protein
MTLAPSAVPERGPIDAGTFVREVEPAYQPVVLRGQVADWPAVAAGRQGAAAVARYISGFDEGKPAEVIIGPPDIKGRFFYSDDMRGFNFRREQAPLSALLQELLRIADDAAPPALYAGAGAAPDLLPGWQTANPLPLPTPGATPRIWIGNATQVATHYDVSSNIACVIAGQRTFTLFPPTQIANLYVGPLETTLAGQPTSMVDPLAPDLDRYPLFAEAAKRALVAELAPGDALYIPSLWWHHVQAHSPLNVLLNYWWGIDDEAAPFPAMIHALLAIRDVPRAERDTWKAWFDHYIFGAGADTVADHLPVDARGVLGLSSPSRTKLMREYLLRALSR